MKREGKMIQMNLLLFFNTIFFIRKRIITKKDFQAVITKDNSEIN